MISSSFISFRTRASSGQIVMLTSQHREDKLSLHFLAGRLCLSSLLSRQPPNKVSKHSSYTKILLNGINQAQNLRTPINSSKINPGYSRFVKHLPRGSMMNTNEIRPESNKQGLDSLFHEGRKEDNLIQLKDRSKAKRSERVEKNKGNRGYIQGFGTVDDEEKSVNRLCLTEADLTDGNWHTAYARR